MHWSEIRNSKKLNVKILSTVPTRHWEDNDETLFHGFIFRINGTYEKVII